VLGVECVKEVADVAKTVVHIFHDDPDSLTLGSRLPQRMNEIAAAQGVELEIFCFGPAQRRLADTESDAAATYNRQLDELIAAGVHVGACINAAKADGTEDLLRKRGFDLQVARDEFLRFTIQGATVLTF
jgi:hypothetical protein